MRWYSEMLPHSTLHILRRFLTPHQLTILRCLQRGLPLPRWGNIRKHAPFSTYFGFDRGTPIDRYYINIFFATHASSITGDILELQAAGYATRYGNNVNFIETVDIEPAFNPTYCVDLCNEGATLPLARFDCILLPNSLSFFRDMKACLRNSLRMLKPGGVILAAGASFVPLDTAPEFQRFTSHGLREQIRDAVGSAAETQIHQFGSCVSSVASLLGLCAEELTSDELDQLDEHYPVTICAKIEKLDTNRKFIQS